MLCDQRGAKCCQYCKSSNTEVTHTRHPCVGLTVRYHVCLNCRGRFRTEERQRQNKIIKKCDTGSIVS